LFSRIQSGQDDEGFEIVKQGAALLWVTMSVNGLHVERLCLSHTMRTVVAG